MSKEFNLSKPEMQFRNEFPLLEQTVSWREGMQYRYSPDYYQINPDQLQALQNCGSLMGELLSSNYPGNQIVEFRIDYVPDENRRLFVTEVQTDDRGLPAMIMTRNAKGPDTQGVFPGLAETFTDILHIEAGKTNPSMLLVYPDNEAFYYAGFYDAAKICWATKPETEIVVTPQSAVKSNPDSTHIDIDMKDEGFVYKMEPDFVWDFTQSVNSSNRRIQTPVDKQLLLDVWQSQNNISNLLQEYIPKVVAPTELTEDDNKDKWMLKPVAGRWSQGITVGWTVGQEEWDKKLREGDMIAQRFISPGREQFTIRNKKGQYKREDLYSRVEGYYSLTSEGWVLADVLATCTSDILVHGKRDCIMIPGIVT